MRSFNEKRLKLTHYNNKMA